MNLVPFDNLWVTHLTDIISYVLGGIGLVWVVKIVIGKLSPLLKETAFYNETIEPYIRKIPILFGGPRIKSEPCSPEPLHNFKNELLFLKIMIKNRSLFWSRLTPTKSLNKGKIYLHFYDSNKRTVGHEMLIRDNVSIERLKEIAIYVAVSDGVGLCQMHLLGPVGSGLHSVLIPDEMGVASCFTNLTVPPSLPGSRYYVCLKVFEKKNKMIEDWFELRNEENPKTFCLSKLHGNPLV